jgi:WhiB family transcriptional regulator, redox-sensing transcriptional regulator
VTVMLDKAPTQTDSPCLTDPERWFTGGHDAELKTLCRGCPRRWTCAKEALDTPGIEGVVAGVHVPKDGRARTFALRQLQSLAAYAGYASQPEIP